MKNETLIERDDVRELVRRKYGEVALRVLSGQTGSCCGSPPPESSACCGDTKTEDGCCTDAKDPITASRIVAMSFCEPRSCRLQLSS